MAAAVAASPDQARINHLSIEPIAVPRGKGERRLRVLAAIIVPPHLSASGGASAARSLSAALTRHCDISVASMMASRGAEREAQALKRLPVTTRLPPFLPWERLPRALRSLFFRSDIDAHVRSGEFDLVHLHNPIPALEFARVAAACRARCLPYVISTHGFNEIANGERIYGFGAARRLVWRRCVVHPVRRAVRSAAAVFALSPADEPIVRAMGYEGPIVQVPNGVASAGPSDPDDDARRCARIGVPPRGEADPLTLMFLANHTPNKGLGVLGQTLQRLRIPYLAIVAGEKRPDVDYEALARSVGPGQRIIITGRLDNETVPALMRRSDLFVFPTLADTFPLVVLEAMAQGLPVVASDLGGIPHQLDACCGVLVPPGAPEALAHVIEDLFEQPEWRHLMGLNARQRVQTFFTWESAAAAAWEGYTLALKRHRSATMPRNAPRRAPSIPR